MNKIPLILLLVIVTTLGSCEKSNPEQQAKSLILKQSLEISPGECISDDNQLEICFDSVSSDSRCAIDVQCVWEGNAAVEVTFSINGENHQLTLNTNGQSRFPADTTINQYHITLSGLAPEPVSTVKINQEDYVATLVIDELED